MSELPLINEHKSPDLKIGLRKCFLAHYISLGKSSILPVKVKIRLKIVQDLTVAIRPSCNQILFTTQA